MIDRHDTDVLRRLAERKAEIAQDPVNTERREAWYRLDAGDAPRPMVLAEVAGIRDAVHPLPASERECTGDWALGIEAGLRQEIYQFEVLKDDHVVEPWINTGWQVSLGDYGVAAVQHQPTDYDGMGAKRWDPPITDLDRDFDTLSPRRPTVDRPASLEAKARLEEVFGGILPVRLRGSYWWTMGMTMTGIHLVGLEGLMLLMYDNPGGLHRLMAFLRDDHLAVAEWCEREGVLGLNNENDYIGSGSMGYTRDLPRPGANGGNGARLQDLWVLSESQETVGVGPELFEEFIFPYQLAVAERFGKCYYGCCEPVNNRWHILKRLPNLARLSVSPWADEEFLAAELGDRYVYSRKPNPSQISTGVFDEEAIRGDLRRTLTAAKGCRLEIAMKDVHTLHDEPGRLPRWVQLAREVIEES